jgi:hypothetical protein
MIVRLYTEPPEETIRRLWRRWKAARRQVVAPTLLS